MIVPTNHFGLSNKPNPLALRVKVLKCSSVSLIVVSIVALAALFILSQYHILPALSSLVLYVPSGGVGGLGAILGALTLPMRSSISSAKKAMQEPSITVKVEEPKIEEQEVSKSPSPEVTSQLLKELSLRSELHPTATTGDQFIFEEEELLQVDSSGRAFSCFLTLMGDFMAHDLQGISTNAPLSLSFLIQQLEIYKTQASDREKLDSLIKRLRIAYKFIRYQKQLTEASSLTKYQVGKKEFEKGVMHTLEQEGSILLSGGFEGKPAGHLLTIELFLQEGLVSAILFNRGEGIGAYHQRAIGESERIRALHLCPVSVEEFKKSQFLDLVTDLQLLQLQQSESTFDVEKETSYSIEDVYEVFIRSWLGQIDDNTGSPFHSPQHGDSCSLKPFVGLIRESIGEEEGKRVKLFLEVNVFELLLKYVDLKALDVERIKDALAKLNRTAVTLQREGILEEPLKKRVLELSIEVTEKIQEEQLRRKGLLQKRAIDFGLTEDKGAYALALFLGSAMQRSFSAAGVKPVIFEKLPSLNAVGLSSYLATAHQIVRRARKGGQLKYAARVAHQALDALPQPSSLLWDCQKNDQLIAIITSLVDTLLKNKISDSGLIRFSANEVTLFLKVVTICLHQAKRAGIPSEVALLYGSQVKMVLETIGHLYRLTHPEYAKTFVECWRTVQQYTASSTSITLKRYAIGDGDWLKRQWELENRPFSSIRELREDTELRFLHDFLQNHSELKETQWPGIINKKNSDTINTLGLFADGWEEGLIFNNITIRETNPSWEVVRQWVYLRQNYFLFLWTSYIVGESSPLLSEKNSRFSIDFQRHTYFNEPGIGRKVISAKYFLPTDPQCLTRGLFGDNFCTFTDKGKKSAEDLFGPEYARITQNRQLKVQVSLNFEEGMDLPPLERQHLLSIQTYDELMVPQLIAYFTRHFHRLKDPRFQALFAQFLFSLNKEKTALVLEEVMRSPSLVKYQLLSFIKSALHQTKKLKWAESHLFFIRTLAQVTRYLVDSSAQSTLAEQAIKLLKEQFTAILAPEKREEQTKKERETALYTLISCAPYLDHPKTLPLLIFCKEAKKEIEGKGYGFTVKDRLQWQEDCALGEGLLESGVEPRGMLPRWVVSHDDYIFDRNFSVEEIEGAYQFYDEKKRCYRLFIDGNCFRIYQLIKGRWYEHRKESPFWRKGFPENGHPCVDGYFTQNVSVWFSVEVPKEALVFSQKSGNLLCRITEEGIFHTDKPWRLATNYEAPVIRHLSRLTPRAEILAWKDEKNNLVCVELFQFGLHFSLQEGVWKSSEHSGYYLDPHYQSPSLEPYTHYIILRNKKGERIALLPTLGVEPKKQRALNLMQPEYKQLTKELSLVTLPLNKNGKVKIPDNPHHALYLLYLAMRKYDYELAHTLIQRMQRERPEWEPSWTLWIQDLEVSEKEEEHALDRHPEAVVLRMRLRLLMLQFSSVPLTDGMLRGLQRDYFVYLNLRKQTMGMSLTPKEERGCHKLLERAGTLSTSEKFRLAVRKHALNEGNPIPEEAPIESAIPLKRPQEVSPSFLWINGEIEQAMRKHHNDPVPVVVPMRPGSAMIKNCLYYYAIAHHLPKTHTLHLQLLEQLRLCRFMSDAKLRSIHQLLMNVSQEPEKFPSIKDILSSKESIGRQFEQLKDKFVSIQPEEWSFSAKKGSILHRTKATSHSFEPTKPGSSEKAEVEKGKFFPFDLETLVFEAGYLIEQPEEEHNRQIEADEATLVEMRAFFKGLQEADPCVKREYLRLIAGVDKKLAQLEQARGEVSYCLDTSKREGLKTYLENLYQLHEQQMAAKKAEIIHLAHSYPEELQLEAKGRMLHPLSLKELIICLGTDDDDAIYRSNPSLTREKLKVLKELLTAYLLLATEGHHILHLSDCLEDSTEESGQFVKEVAAERAYDSREEPHLLVFEYFAKMRLRKEQCEALRGMTGAEDNIELEARTGFGKSKVLIPLWLFLKSRREKTAMMTVPSSLFVAQHSHLKKILGKAFDLCIVPIQFNRGKAGGPLYLKRLCKKLKDARGSHKIVLTTIHALHGMANLKFKESLATGSGESETKLQKQLKELRAEISSHLAAFFDESKVCFDLRHHYDYAVGAPSSLNGEQIHSACTIYRALFIENSEISTWALEFLPPQEGSIRPLRENYEGELLPLFAKRIATFFHIPLEMEQAVLQDLQGNYSERCAAFYTQLSPGERAEYSRMKKQLIVHLSRTLFRKCDDGYGFIPGSRLAIPFLDTVPKRESEFSAVEDYIDFTIQTNLKKPFLVEEITAFIEKLKVRCVQEGLIEQNLPEYQLLQRVISKPLMDVSTEDYEEITQKINSDLNLKLYFIEWAVLPQIKIYKKKITSTAFNLVRAIDHLQAASGTVSPETLPPRLITQEDKTAVIDNLMALWRESNVGLLPRGCASQQLTALLGTYAEEQVLIDVAGNFRELDIETTAHTILEAKKEVQGVLLYDEEGRELVYERESQTFVPREESMLTTKQLFIFIRKSKAVGTDIDIERDAKALVTVDRETPLDLFLQGSGRMRKLREGQKIRYVVEEGGEKTFPKLLAQVTRNRGRQKGEDVFYALRLYLEDLIEGAFWRTAEQAKDIAEVQKVFKALEPFLVKETQSNPLSTLGKKRGKVKAKEAVAQLKQELLGPLQEFCKAHSEWAKLFDLKGMEKEFDAYVDYKKLPESIAVHDGGDTISTVEADVTAEAEQEAEAEEIAELDMENENVADKVSDLPRIDYPPADPLPWDGDYVHLCKGAPVRELLAVSIYHSPNYARVSGDEEKNGLVQKPAYQYLVHMDAKGRCKMVLLDLHDARAVLKRMEQRQAVPGNYYLVSGIYVIAFVGSKPLRSLNKVPEMVPLILLHKMYIAASTLTLQEREYLKRLSPEERDSFLKEAKRLLPVWPHLSPYVAEYLKTFKGFA